MKHIEWFQIIANISLFTNCRLSKILRHNLDSGTHFFTQLQNARLRFSSLFAFLEKDLAFRRLDIFHQARLLKKENRWNERKKNARVSPLCKNIYQKELWFFVACLWVGKNILLSLSQLKFLIFRSTMISALLRLLRNHKLTSLVVLWLVRVRIPIFLKWLFLNPPQTSLGKKQV